MFGALAVILPALAFTGTAAGGTSLTCFGEKTAAELLREHGSLEGVLDAAIRISKPKLRTTLIESRDDLLAYKDIATLRDAGVEAPADRDTDWTGAAAAARERGMNRLAKRLDEAAEAASAGG